MPEYVRVGLKYRDSAFNETALNSSTGILAGVLLPGGVFESVLSFSADSKNSFRIWKDGFYGGVWHVIASHGFKSFGEAQIEADILKQAGYVSWPAYIGGWKVLSGAFSDSISAQNSANDIISKTGRSQAVIFQSKNPTAADVASSLIVIGDSSRNILFYYANVNNSSLIFKAIAPPDAAGSESPPLITVDGTPKYRGNIEISRRFGSDMTAINILPMDEYLYGVIPAEIGASSPAEAIKAQAVVARTYAMSQILLSKHSQYGFDLCTTVDCQSYKGYNVEGKDSSRYISETTGKIITYTYNSGPKTGQKELAQVFYFSTSGGKTENCENVWVASLPYLVSVDDPYEPAGLPYSNWTTAKTAEMISQYTGISKILGINIIRLTQSGRVLELEVKGQNQDGSVKIQTYTKEKTRTIFQLYSQLYRVESDSMVSLAVGQSLVRRDITGVKAVTKNGFISLTASNPGTYNVVAGAGGVIKKIPSVPENYIFVGKGWGHGVGMSQNGAIGMAKAGKSYQEIITHYFTGVTIE